MKIWVKFQKNGKKSKFAHFFENDPTFYQTMEPFFWTPDNTLKTIFLLKLKCILYDGCYKKSWIGCPKKRAFAPKKILKKNLIFGWTHQNKTNNFRELFMGQRHIFLGHPILSCQGNLGFFMSWLAKARENILPLFLCSYYLICLDINITFCN